MVRSTCWTLLLTSLAACGSGFGPDSEPSGPAAVRLVQHFAAARVTGTPPAEADLQQLRALGYVR